MKKLDDLIKLAEAATPKWGGLGDLTLLGADEDDAYTVGINPRTMLQMAKTIKELREALVIVKKECSGNHREFINYSKTAFMSNNAWENIVCDQRTTARKALEQLDKDWS